MNKKNPILLLLTILAFSACQNNENQMPGESAIPLPVVEVPRKDIHSFTTYPVSIEGTVNSAVRAKISGYITEVLIDEGQAVKEGQSLFRLETLSLSQDAEAAQANVQAAQVEVDKLTPLVEKGIISSVQLETAKARLEQARASFSSLNANIDYATIKSPVDGFAGAIPYRVGSLISPADPTPLTVVSDTRQVYAYFSMNEKAYLDFILNTPGETLDDKIKNFPPVELELVNGAIYEQKGSIETVTGQVNKSTGTISFRAIFPNPNRILANGNSGRIRVPFSYSNVVVVPEISTFEQQSMVYVYTVDENGRALSTPIEVLDRVNNLVLIKSGLEAGTQIVAEGLGKIRHNASVIPQPVDFDSVANSIQVVFK